MPVKRNKNNSSDWSLPKNQEKQIVKGLKQKAHRTPKEVRADSRNSLLDVIRNGAIEGAVKAGANQNQADVAGKEAVRLALKRNDLRRKIDEVSYLTAKVVQNPELLPYIQAEIIYAYSQLFGAAASFSYEATKLAVRRMIGSFKWRLRRVMRRLNPVFTVMRIVDILKLIISAIKAAFDNLGFSPGDAPA